MTEPPRCFTDSCTSLLISSIYIDNILNQKCGFITPSPVAWDFQSSFCVTWHTSDLSLRFPSLRKAVTLPLRPLVMRLHQTVDGSAELPDAAWGLYPKTQENQWGTRNGLKMSGGKKQPMSKENLQKALRESGLNCSRSLKNDTNIWLFGSKIYKKWAVALHLHTVSHSTLI